MQVPKGVETPADRSSLSEDNLNLFDAVGTKTYLKCFAVTSARVARIDDYRLKQPAAGIEGLSCQFIHKIDIRDRGQFSHSNITLAYLVQIVAQPGSQSYNERQNVYRFPTLCKRLTDRLEPSLRFYSDNGADIHPMALR